MTMLHSHRPRSGRRPGRRLDLAGLALLLLGLVFAVISYRLVAGDGVNPLVMVPSIVAATVGASNIFKYEAPRH